MIDIHSHVLPGLDDGSDSLEESLAMLRIAAESGTTDIVATPHANLEFTFDPDVVRAKLAELRQEAGPLIRIHSGCDFHLYYDNIQDALSHPAKYTVNGLRYLLVEFPDLLIAKSAPEVFSRLVSGGMVPIVTHPERNFLLHSKLEEIGMWIEIGALVQVTGQSLLGRFGNEAREFARQLMNRGMVHFIASDAHDASDRTPRLDDAYDHVVRRWGKPRADRLFVANPQAVITGEPLPTAPVEAQPGAKRWYSLWR